MTAILHRGSQSRIYHSLLLLLETKLGLGRHIYDLPPSIDFSTLLKVR